MSDKRRGLGRGLGALIPPAPPAKGSTDRPVDVFFPDRGDGQAEASTSADGATTTAAAAGSAPAEGATVPAQAQPTESAPAPAGEPLLPVPGASFAELPLTSITPNARQPRQVFDEEDLAELIHSVKEIGVLQPIVVRRAGEKDGRPAYELIMGERRWRASQQAGLDTIPAIVRDTSDDDMLRDALLENLHRSQLNALEEAAAYQQLLDDFGCTHEELATRIGRSRPQISNTIRLLRLPPTVQRRVAAGVLSAGHARALLGLDDGDAMDKLAQRIVNEGLSVRATEEAVALTDGDTAAPAAARRKPRAGGHHAELDELSTRLADRLDTRVSIALGRSKGKLSIEFASVEDLNRILDILAPEERKAFQS
ncbi:ParB/RepB/Spo0J family partition protein [Spongisporangium articulatum]|uniref:ParB/RepB/Spo0J family partition protein n=1 Tax=Spongisporangium articulatum TaxID=3362603 RepID=A0ABW8AK82_9ACTN